MPVVPEVSCRGAKQFPQVKQINNNENVGFPKGNNIGVAQWFPSVLRPFLFGLTFLGLHLLLIWPGEDDPTNNGYFSISLGYLVGL